MAENQMRKVSDRVRSQIEEIMAGVEAATQSPHTEEVTPKQLRSQMSKMTPDERLAAARSFPGGEEAFLRFING